MEQEAGPLVTIGIPTYNRRDLLERAIASCLAQDYPRVEVVVSDNASTDGTWDFLGSLADGRLRLLRQGENIGLVGNWNACLAAARGEYFLMLCDDDCLHPDAVTRLLAPFHPGAPEPGQPPPDQVAFSYGYCHIHNYHTGEDSISLAAPPWETGEAYRLGCMGGRRISYPSATLLRTADALQVGGYGGRSAASIDTELVFLLSGLRPFVACTSSPVTEYLLHPESVTTRFKANELMHAFLSLGELAQRLSAAHSPAAETRARRAGRRYAASVTSWMLTDSFYVGNFSRRSTLSRLWDFRALFRNPAEWPVLAKALAKVILGKPIGKAGK